MFLKSKFALKSLVFCLLFPLLNSPLLGEGPHWAVASKAKVFLKDGSIREGYLLWNCYDYGADCDFTGALDCIPDGSTVLRQAGPIPRYVSDFCRHEGKKARNKRLQHGALDFRRWAEYFNLRAAHNFDGLSAEAEAAYQMLHLVPLAAPIGLTVAAEDSPPLRANFIQKIVAEGRADGLDLCPYAHMSQGSADDFRQRLLSGEKPSHRLETYGAERQYFYQDEDLFRLIVAQHIEHYSGENKDDSSCLSHLLRVDGQSIQYDPSTGNFEYLPSNEEDATKAPLPWLQDLVTKHNTESRAQRLNRAAELESDVQTQTLLAPENSIYVIYTTQCCE